MIVPTPWLIRNPTIKEQARDLGLIAEGEDVTSINYGHLGYPVLQAADILIYKGNVVPVGEDQVAHVELTREIARRFNYLYGEVFPEPEPLLTNFPRVIGTDGRRMSKSLKNTILMADPPLEIEKKVKTMYTDPLKVYKGDPGHPDKCPVFAFYQMFNYDRIEEIKNDCEKGRLGCVECKEMMAKFLSHVLAPVRERRFQLEADHEKVDQILIAGSKKARKVAQETMEEVREAMKLW